MMALALIGVPLAMAALALALPWKRVRPWAVVAGGSGHLVVVIVALARDEPVEAFDRWLVLDPLGKVFLTLISVVFFACALYTPGYLALRPGRPNRSLCACMLLSLALMTVVSLAHHLGLMWVAVEAITLATALNIYFNQNHRALEATWKYLLICSVGIAVALLGSFFLAYAAFYPTLRSTLLFEELIGQARGEPGLKPEWLQAAFVMLLAGYGTKMGLAPMHTWKPDAYGEAPGVVGAMLAGCVTTCAFLAILRFYKILDAAGQTAFAQELMVFMGLLSMATGAVFMVRQRDFKRMLAYSSVEHMGILVLGVGIGGSLAMFGVLLHLINNALTKGVLFLSAGNIHRAFDSKYVDDVRGAMRLLPVSGSLFLLGFLAIAGSPPFGPFLSEFTILRGALSGKRYVIAAIYLALLAMVFVGMGGTVLKVVQGQPLTETTPRRYRDRLTTAGPILLLMALVLLLGVYVPPPLEAMLRNAVEFLESH
ncbi:MAG TPA: proton-conducting transporter membrane subunit [Gemmataceae bacterium]|nr:proton-conducting transporter membrane subunit [Gemmataceae bacterium]